MEMRFTIISPSEASDNIFINIHIINAFANDHDFRRIWDQIREKIWDHFFGFSSSFAFFRYINYSTTTAAVNYHISVIFQQMKTTKDSIFFLKLRVIHPFLQSIRFFVKMFDNPFHSVIERRHHCPLPVTDPMSVSLDSEERVRQRIGQRQHNHNYGYRELYESVRMMQSLLYKCKQIVVLNNKTNVHKVHNSINANNFLINVIRTQDS